MSDVKDVSEALFDQEVVQASQPVLVDFWAPWCGPCKMIAPALQELAGDYRGRLKVVKVNVDDYPDLAAKFDIMGIPTILLFKEGRVVDSFTGAMSKQTLADKIEPHI